MASSPDRAQGTAAKSPLVEYITRIRHNLAAHYYQPKVLFRGYQNFFFERQKDSFNESAIASFGDRVEETRFYFADAAAQMAQMKLDPSEERIKELRTAVLAMFRALRFVIEAYMALKRDALKAS